MTLSLHLRHDFPSAKVDVTFEVPSPGVTVLFGPSGAGKSTIVLAAAGLLRPTDCRIAIDGQILADTAAGIWLPPEQRRAGLVFGVADQHLPKSRRGPAVRNPHAPARAVRLPPRALRRFGTLSSTASVGGARPPRA